MTSVNATVSNNELALSLYQSEPLLETAPQADGTSIPAYFEPSSNDITVVISNAATNINVGTGFGTGSFTIPLSFFNGVYEDPSPTALLSAAGFNAAHFRPGTYTLTVTYPLLWAYNKDVDGENYLYARNFDNDVTPSDTVEWIISDTLPPGNVWSSYITPYENGLITDNESIRTVLYANNSIYIGLRYHNITSTFSFYKASFSNPSSWTAIHPLSPTSATVQNFPVTGLAADSSGNKIIVCTGDGNSAGLFRSEDAGATWTQIYSSDNWVSVASSSDGTKILAATRTNNNDGSLFISNDSGANWSIAGVSRGWTSVSMSADGTKLFAGSYGEMYMSTNSGSTWTQLAEGNIKSIACSSDGTKLLTCQSAIDSHIPMFGLDGSTLLQGTTNLRRSTDGGANWTTLSSAGPGNWTSVASSSDGMSLAIVNGNGYISTSEDGGTTWEIQSTAGAKFWSSISMDSTGSKIVGGSEFLDVDSGPIYSNVAVLSKYSRNINTYPSLNSITLNWEHATDDTTPEMQLSYELYWKQGTFSATDYSGIVSEAEASQVSYDLSNWSVEDAPSSTQYSFRLFVVDQAGNKSMYNGASSTTATNLAPTPGSMPTFEAVTHQDLELHWHTTTDDFTPANGLQYKVVKALSSAAIDTVGEADAIVSAPNLIMDWTYGDEALLGYPNPYNYVSGLSASTTYYFAVLVKDEQGNKSLYPIASQATSAAPDTTAPTVTDATLTIYNITQNNITLNWLKATDTVTSQANLRYFVYKNLNNAPSTLEQVEAGTAENPDGTLDLNNLVIDTVGLQYDNFSFDVIVHDEAGNKFRYNQASYQVTDVTAPTPTGTPTFENVTTDSLELYWQVAEDNFSPATTLQYKIVKALSSAAIDSVSEANAITGAGLVMDWDFSDTLTYAVTGLNASTTYFFAVLVKDAAGNMSLYSPASQATSAAPDVTAPTVGSGPSFGATTSSSIVVNWTAATDAVTAQGSLQYKLVRASTSAAIDTVSEADSATLVMDWTNALTYTASGLSASTTYFFAVLVKDAAGNMSLYSPASQATSASEGTPPATINEANSTVSSGTTTWGNGSSLAITSPATVQSGATLVLNITSLTQLTGSSAITVKSGGSVVINGRTTTVKPGTILKIKPRP